MPIYMKYEGIIGKVTKKPYAGWVELRSVIAREPPASIIDIVKLEDGTRSQFYSLAIRGDHKNVTVDFVDDHDTLYLRLELKNTFISGYVGMGGYRDERFESLSLTFTKMTSTPQAPLKDQKQAMHSMEFQRVQQRMS